MEGGQLPLCRLGPIDEVDDPLHAQLALFCVEVCLSPTAAGFQPTIRHTTLSLWWLFHEGTRRGFRKDYACATARKTWRY